MLLILVHYLLKYIFTGKKYLNDLISFRFFSKWLHVLFFFEYAMLLKIMRF